MIAKRTLFLLIVGMILCGCSSEPVTDCDKGLCGQKWALELDSAVAHGEARVQTHPDDVDALLQLAEAYIQKALFLKNQTDTRVDFWLSSNLRKIGCLLDEALRACDEALQQKQNVAKAYQLKGKSYLLRSQLKEDREQSYVPLRTSIECLERAVSLDSTSAEMWYTLGLARNQIRWWSPEEPRRCFEKAIELDPTYAKAYTALGKSWYKAREQMYLAARKLKPRDPDVLRDLAWPYSGYSLPDASADWFQSVPTIVLAPFAMGASLFIAKYGEVESRIFREIVRNDHHYSKDHRWLANFCRTQSLDEAVKHYRIWHETNDYLGELQIWRLEWDLRQKMIEAFEGSPWPYLYLGSAYNMEADSALELFKTAIRIDSSLALGHYLIAATYAEKGDWSNAEQQVTRMLREGSSDEFVTLNSHILRTLIHGRKGETAAAIRECEITLRIDSSYAQQAFSWGIFGRRRDLHSGRLWFVLDQPISPRSVTSPSERKTASLLNLWSGWGYYRGVSSWDGKYNDFFQKAIELDPENLAAYYALVTMHSYQGEYDKAANLARKVLRLHPNDPKAHKSLGEVYLFANRLDEAKQEFQRAHQLGDFEAKLSVVQVEELIVRKAQQ